MNTICALCHVTNPVPEDHLADGAKCGRCGHGLFGGGVINATATTLDQLRQGDLPVVVGFWAPWCRPCRSFAPLVC